MKAAPKAPGVRLAPSATSGTYVKVSHRTVQAARLRQTINDRLGKPTSPVTAKIAAIGR